MNTEEIKKIIKSYLGQQNREFQGVFAKDQLKRPSSFPASYVINTDSSHKPGKHWVCIYFTNDKNVEYFDSFGFPPTENEIIEFIFRHKNCNIIYNARQFQSLTSITCGAFCVIYIILKNFGVSFCDLVRFFSNNLEKNDLVLQKRLLEAWKKEYKSK